MGEVLLLELLKLAGLLRRSRPSQDEQNHRPNPGRLQQHRAPSDPTIPISQGEWPRLATPQKYGSRQAESDGTRRVPAAMGYRTILAFKWALFLCNDPHQPKQPMKHAKYAGFTAPHADKTGYSPDAEFHWKLILV